MKKFTLSDAAATWTMMTRSNRPVDFLAVVLALATIFLLAPAATPALAAGTPPFCVLQGGSNGPGSSPQICTYYDLQVCMQAAADLRGNCWKNIDYHGPDPTQSAPVRARRHPHASMKIPRGR